MDSSKLGIALATLCVLRRDKVKESQPFSNLILVKLLSSTCNGIGALGDSRHIGIQAGEEIPFMKQERSFQQSYAYVVGRLRTQRGRGQCCTRSSTRTSSSAAVRLQVLIQDITDDAKTTNDVVSYGMGLQGQRFSPLDKLNADTVKV